MFALSCSISSPMLPVASITNMMSSATGARARRVERDRELASRRSPAPRPARRRARPRPAARARTAAGRQRVRSPAGRGTPGRPRASCASATTRGHRRAGERVAPSTGCPSRSSHGDDAATAHVDVVHRHPGAQEVLAVEQVVLPALVVVDAAGAQHRRTGAALLVGVGGSARTAVPGSVAAAVESPPPSAAPRRLLLPTSAIARGAPSSQPRPEAVPGRPPPHPAASTARGDHHRQPGHCRCEPASRCASESPSVATVEGSDERGRALRFPAIRRIPGSGRRRAAAAPGRPAPGARPDRRRSMRRSSNPAIASDEITMPRTANGLPASVPVTTKWTRREQRTAGSDRTWMRRQTLVGR